MLFDSSEAEAFREDVLRACVNLENDGNANWLKIRDWLRVEAKHHIRDAALNIMRPEGLIKYDQGAARILDDLVDIVDHPREKTLAHQARKATIQSKPKAVI